MRTYNFQNIIPVNTVMNATINSLPMNLANMIGYTIQIFFTGTPTGSFKLQASADEAPLIGSGFNPTNWTDVVATTFTISAAGNVEWNVYDIYYNFVRVVYTDTSGGTSTAIITVSTFNGKGP